MIKLSLKTLFESQGGLHSILNTKLNDLKASYWISKASKKLVAEFKNIDKARTAFLEKNGVVAGKELDQAVRVKLDAEFEDFLKTEIELDINKFKFDYLKEVKLSPNELASLDWLIEEPVEVSCE